MRKLLIAIFILPLLLPMKSEARHIAGGEMSYTYLGSSGGGTVGRYAITLRLYRDCQSGGAQLDEFAAITIYENGSTAQILNLSVPKSREDRPTLTNPGPCIDNPPIVCYQVGIYTTTVELPFSNSGYTIAYQRCCRIENIANVSNSGGAGATYVATIPGLFAHPKGPVNSTPVFSGSDTVLICKDNAFLYDFSAKDPDGDSLVYEYAEAYNFQQTGTPMPTSALPPPYESVTYSFGYTASLPMGPNAPIDPKSGVIRGRAPVEGIYVVTVNVLEYREGKLINRHRKDLHIKVANCSIAAADLDPVYITCDGFNLSFQNNNNSPLIKSYFWDFGIPGMQSDTSNAERPIFTFPDTGVYKVMLVTNRNQECSDTGYTLAKVYPGFFPGFTVEDGCRNVPLKFTDTTKTRYGAVDYWRWTFGHPIVNPKTDTTRNPTYSYPDIGTYDVQLIVGSSKGCRDTVETRVSVIDKPSLKVTQSQPLCQGDSLQLTATGTGVFAWSPSTGLSDPNIANPVAFPRLKTKYYVTLTNAPGCVNRDSVEIDVKAFVTLNAGNDTVICLTDTLRLQPSSDGTHFSWLPAASLDDPGVKNPLAKPTGTTTYQVTAWIGEKKNCISTDAVKVTTIPYPSVAVGPDTTICYGDTVRLRASGGFEYRWTPTTNLEGNTSPTPRVWPLRTTTYRVAVRDNAGCPKPSFANVVVSVTPRILANAGKDTSIVVGQPFRLQGSGGESYRWSPPTGLSNPNIADPSVAINEDQRYVLKASNDNGCYAIDTVDIRVFKTDPDIFVPTAFTPNGDKLNDILTPIPVGISQFQFFRLYNRWGQLVFGTTEVGVGWDGSLKGREQASDTYVWHVRGVDFTGRAIDKKGTTSLIR
jgi:gliding motility-associated-like protein